MVTTRWSRTLQSWLATQAFIATPSTAVLQSATCCCSSVPVLPAVQLISASTALRRWSNDTREHPMKWVARTGKGSCHHARSAERMANPGKHWQQLQCYMK
ncbi:hypothetical protein COO60DRAFT_391307 [Scenedesmus sp. NREL 46B-D3]|nr:hypothetical protein COO60DRAFT_391307 [Scenedesmus sp. NREL 46B-D3]